MGFKAGNGLGSVQVGSTPSTRRNEGGIDRFRTSYDRSFAHLPPPSSNLRQVGFLELCNLAGQSSRQPRRVQSEASLSRSLKASRSTWQATGRPATSPSLSTQQSLEVTKRSLGQNSWENESIGCDENPKNSSAEFWSINRNSQHILEHTPRKIRRAVCELLTNPDLEALVKQLFDRHSQRGHRKGQLPAGEVNRVIHALIKEFQLPEHCVGLADLLLKRFDVNRDDMYAFPEFFDLFLAMLRRAAFDRSAITGRDFFVSETMDPVWSIWDKVKKLGEGSFGAAFTCKHKASGEVRVIKAIKKSSAKVPVEDIEREIIIMRQIDHPHVVRLFGWHEDASSIFLVMEALQGGTLRDVLFYKGQKFKPIKEEWIRTVMRQLIEGMAFCHKLRVVHKDLKDENIMLLRQDQDYDKPFAVIIDLGLAEMFSHVEPRCQQCGGTPTTMAPEVWLDDFGPKCDVWSLGVVLYEMFTGCFPFIAKSLRPMAWVRLQKRGANWSLVKSTELGRAVCKSMLTYSEDERPSMSSFLRHDWFRSDSVVSSKISSQQFAKLKTFCEESKLQRTLLLEIASRLPMEKAGKVVEMFESFDTDGDGSLSKAEIKAAFSAMGMCDQDLIARIFSTLDVDVDGLLALSEFSAGVLVLFKDLLDDRLQALFARRDRDGSGYLDADEIKEFLTDSCAMLTMEANKRSFDLLDELMQGGQTKIRYADLRGKLLGF